MHLNRGVVYDLKDTSPMFTHENTFMRYSKLVVPSEEVLRRLVFMLKLHLHTNKVDMLTFQRSKVIKDYYDDLDDYKLIQSQFLFDNSDAVKRLVANKDIRYVIVDKIIPGEKQPPHFFQNPLVGSNAVYLAQNAPNYDMANAIVYGWRTKRLNIPFKVLAKRVFIYAYENHKDIKVIQEGSNILEVILGYKLSNVPRYTVLMKL